MNKRNVRTAAASVAVIAGALTLFAACDWGNAPKAQGASVGNADRGAITDTADIRLKTSEEWVNLNKVASTYEEHDDTYWHLSIYYHRVAKENWDTIKDYGLKALGSKASIVYWEDKRSGLHYDHYHWYLVVNDTKIAEYEKVGGNASAAYDHVRLLKSWWDYQFNK